MGNLPIGQGESVTPIQMATAYAAIANGGILRPPHIVSSIDGQAQCPQPPGHRVISTTTAAELRQMLAACSRPAAPPARSRSPAISSPARPAPPTRSTRATGEYSNTAYVASFVGFAPASDPKLLCAVIVDEPQSGSIYGGTVAAPGVRADHGLRAALPGDTTQLRGAAPS